MLGEGKQRKEHSSLRFTGERLCCLLYSSLPSLTAHGVCYPVRFGVGSAEFKPQN